MKYTLLLLLMYFAAVFETTAVQPWTVFDIAPRFLLLVAMAAVLMFNDWRAIAWTAVCGLVSDCLHGNSSPLGIELILACCLAVVYQQTLSKEKEEQRQSVLLTFLLCVGFVFFVNATSDIVRGALGNNALDIVSTIEWSLWSSLYSAALFIIGVLCVRKIKTFAPLSRRRVSTELTNQWKMLT